MSFSRREFKFAFRTSLIRCLSASLASSIWETFRPLKGCTLFLLLAPEKKIGKLWKFPSRKLAPLIPFLAWCRAGRWTWPIRLMKLGVLSAEASATSSFLCRHSLAVDGAGKDSTSDCFCGRPMEVSLAVYCVAVRRSSHQKNNQPEIAGRIAVQFINKLIDRELRGGSPLRFIPSPRSQSRRSCPGRRGTPARTCRCRPSPGRTSPPTGT